QWVPSRRLIECVPWAPTKEDSPVTRRIATDSDRLNRSCEKKPLAEFWWVSPSCRHAEQGPPTC
ncbi:MAG TPA: hypothetical protein ACN46Q_09785, partial [Prochlorococcus sp.]